MTHFKRTSPEGFTTAVSDAARGARRLRITEDTGQSAFNIYSDEDLEAVAQAIEDGRSYDERTSDGYRTQLSVRSHDVVIRITEADGTTAFDVLTQDDRKAIAAALRA